MNLREKLYDAYQYIRYGRTRVLYFMGRVYKERKGGLTQIPLNHPEPIDVDVTFEPISPTVVEIKLWHIENGFVKDAEDKIIGIALDKTMITQGNIKFGERSKDKST
jgi:hypothetical protein